MICVENLTKRYGEKTAVDSLSFTVRPGIVTGFLGPNGSGKSTTMRVIAGLDRPTSGTALVDGRRYVEHPAPLKRGRAAAGGQGGAHQPHRPATTCARSPRRTASRAGGSTR